jgi:hypothetical protein
MIFPNLPLPLAHSPLVFARCLVVIAALQLPLAAALQAQEGWDSVPVVSDTNERSLSLGIEAGKPLIFGVEGGYNFDERVSGMVGFSTLGDFAAISAELRAFLLRFGTQKALPSVGVGFTQYFLTSGARETSPIAGHLLLGVEYIFPSYLGVGATLGYQHALGSSEDKTVERYDINDDLADWFFAVNARYFF